MGADSDAGRAHLADRGRAIYAEYSLLGRQFVPGMLNIAATDGRGMEVEKAYPAASLAGLLALDQQAFMKKDAVANYAISWSLVHFLMHGNAGRGRDPFLRFFRGCPPNGAVKDSRPPSARSRPWSRPTGHTWKRPSSRPPRRPSTPTARPRAWRASGIGPAQETPRKLESCLKSYAQCVRIYAECVSHHPR